MPIVPNLNVSQFEPLRRHEPIPELNPSLLDTTKAAFDQENDVWAMYKINQEKAYPAQMGFDLIKSAKARDVNPADFSEVLSEDELDFRIAKKRREDDNRAILNASGWTGYAAQMAAGLVSPTTFIPFLRAETGVKAIALGGLSVLAGAASQEATLYASQETRTKGEMAFSLAASTIIGGLLGAAAHTMSKSVVDKIAHDMVNSPKEPTIHEPMPMGGDLSAKENDTILKDVGKLKRGWGADKLAFMSPITRGFEQWNAPAYIKALGGSSELRKTTAGFSQAGLSLQGNDKFVAAAAGGNVEDLKRTYGVVSYLSRKAIDNAYIEYILGTDAKGFAKKSRAVLAGARADGKLNYNEFKRQITLDIWSNFTNENVNPFVRKVAKDIDANVYKKLYDEGVQVGLFTGEEKTVGDENYANRVYNNEVIMRRHEEFVGILKKNLAAKYQQDFAKEFEKLREKMLKDKKMFEDMERPLAEVRKLREEIKMKAQQLETNTSLDVIEGVDAMKGIKNEVKNLTKELEDLKSTKLDGADVEGYRRRQDRMDEIQAALKSKALQADNLKKSLGEGLDNYTKELGEIRRRLAALSQAHALKDERLARKIAKIEANEDMQVQTILRAQKQLQKFVKMLDSATDDKLDEVLSKWKTQFEQNSQKLTKLEEKRFELEKASELPVDGPDNNNPPKPPPPDVPPTDVPPKPPVDTGPVTPPVEVPKAPTPEEVKAKVEAENKIIEETKKEHFLKSLPDLKGLDLQDLSDSQLLPAFMQDILDNPKKFEYVLDNIKKGYIFAKDKIFRQVKKADVEEAKLALAEAKTLFDKEEQEIIKAFAGKATGEKINGVTFDDAMLKIDLKLEKAEEYAAGLDRALKKAEAHAETQVEVPPPKAITVDEVPPLPVVEPPKVKKAKVIPDAETKLNPDLNIAVNHWTTANEALAWLIKHSKDDYNLIAQRLKGRIDDASFYVVDGTETHPGLKNEFAYMKQRNWIGMYSTVTEFGKVRAALYLRKDGGITEMTLLHELIHAATNSRIRFGNDIKNKNTALGKLVKELGDLHKVALEAINKDINAPYKAKYAVGNFRELATVMLTEAPVREYFRKVPYKGKTVFSEFVRVLRDILGIPKEEENVFTAIMDLTDRIVKQKNPLPTEGIKYGSEDYQVIDQELSGSVADAQKNFDDWFAESKVVDDEGKPKILYHGTDKDFTEFSKGKIGDKGLMNNGFFFSESPDVATTYSMWNVNRDFEGEITPKLLDRIKHNFGLDTPRPRIMPVYLSIKNPAIITALSDLPTDTRGLKALGHDGILVKRERGPNVWIAFEPTQIKSAISNSGAYSKKNAHISGALGEDPAMKIEDSMEKVIAKMDSLAEKIDNLDSMDREAWRAEVEDMMRELADTHAKINAKRAVRNEKLWKSVEQLSPEARKAKLDALKLKSSDRPKDFIHRWNTKGELNITKSDGGDLLKGEANFDNYAEDIARQTVTKILGTDRRLAYSDIIQAERGPELARTLNIPSQEISDFLETDIEKLVSTYTRTVGSDLAIARVFGSADAAEAFKRLGDERQLMLKKIETLTDKNGKPLSKEEKEKLSYETHKFYDAGKKDLEVLLERAKSMRGLPKDADSFSARAAKTAMDLNYLRFMGGVVVNSVADVARPIMKYGLTRTFRDGIIPLIQNFKLIRMSQREARLAGTALDMVMHTRANSMMDIFDDAYRGTIAEKGIHYLSTRMGAIALFDQWTVAMKEFTAGIANAKLLDSIGMVMGEPASAAELKKAQEFLARNNIDAEIASTIWSEVTNGKGGGKINGVWLPNTENWNIADPQVARARRAYRAALGGEIDSTIITPGFERPNWVDSSVPARMLAQFKSFGLSTVQKTIMAGLQEHDAAALNGTIASLALGMLSYYIWATAAGGDAQAKMQKSIAEGNWEIWADEAIARSGVTGVISDAQKYAHRIPVLRDYTSFSGSDTTRRAGGDLTESVLGPSFDLLEKAHGLVTGIDDPTKQTLHLARQMLPLQNVFYLRWLLDQVEKSINLPEQRAQ